MADVAQAAPRIAVIGCGRWGANHVRVWHELGCLVAVCDAMPERLGAALEGRDGVEGHEETGALFARDDIDGVVIATPAVSHAEVAMDALRAGKDVLVEKPLAVTLSEAARLTTAAVEADRVLMVGHVLEYHPAFLRLREIVESGDLGQLRYLYSHRLNFGTLRTEENALWSFAPHDIALMLRLLGRSPERVACHGGSWLSPGVADVTMMNLAFAQGVRGHVFVSWLHPFKEHRFVAVGSEAMAVVDDTAPWPEKLRIHQHRVEWVDGRIPIADKAEASFVPLEEGEPLASECREFIDRIRDRQEPLTGAESAIEVLRVLDAGERSMETGVPVGLADAHLAADASGAATVHPTAIVDPGAEVGVGTKVWHHVHISAGATIGRDCVLGQNVYIGNVTVGDGVRIQNNVSVYDGVRLEDDVFCGPSVVFTNVKNPRAGVDRKTEFAVTVVKRGATLGANSTIVCGCTIGQNAFVGAGAVVTSDVPDHAMVAGNPARRIGWVSHAGERLEFRDGKAVCPRDGGEYELTDGSGVVRVDGVSAS